MLTLRLQASIAHEIIVLNHILNDVLHNLLKDDARTNSLLVLHCLKAVCA